MIAFHLLTLALETCLWLTLIAWLLLMITSLRLAKCTYWHLLAKLTKVGLRSNRLTASKLVSQFFDPLVQGMALGVVTLLKLILVNAWRRHHLTLLFEWIALKITNWLLRRLNNSLVFL